MTCMVGGGSLDLKPGVMQCMGWGGGFGCSQETIPTTHADEGCCLGMSKYDAMGCGVCSERANLRIHGLGEEGVCNRCWISQDSGMV